MQSVVKNQITVVSPPRPSILFQQHKNSNSLRQGLNPMLIQLLFESAKLLPNPSPAGVIQAGRKIVFNTWLNYDQDSNGNPRKYN